MDHRTSWEAWARRQYRDPALADVAGRAAMSASAGGSDSYSAAVIGHRAAVAAGAEYRYRPDRTGMAIAVCVVLFLMFTPASLIGLGVNPGLAGYLFLAGSLILPSLAVFGLVLVRRNACFFVRADVAGRRDWLGNEVAAAARPQAVLPMKGTSWWSDNRIGEVWAVARAEFASDVFARRTPVPSEAADAPTPVVGGRMTSGEVIGYIGFCSAFLIVAGSCGIIQNLDASAYDAATKEMVAATVVSTSGGSNRCSVTMDLSGRQLTVQSDPLGGGCDLKPGSEVQVEFWNSKATAIYQGSASWPTTLNPGHGEALGAASIFFGGLVGIVALFLLALKLLSDLLARRRAR